MDDNTPPVVAGVMAHARGADDVSLARNRYPEQISGFDQLLFSPPVGSSTASEGRKWERGRVGPPAPPAARGGSGWSTGTQMGVIRPPADRCRCLGAPVQRLDVLTGRRLRLLE